MTSDIGRAISALHAIPAGCDRQRWSVIGMAAKAAGLTEDDFINWSRTGDNFGSEKDCRSAFKSFKPGKVTEATLYFEAARDNWQDPARAERKMNVHNGFSGRHNEQERPQATRMSEGKAGEAAV